MFAAPFAGGLSSMLSRLDADRAPRRVRLPADLRDEFTFTDAVIVRRGPEGDLTVFSSACTHLGCRISRVAEGVLVCPCHGSRFHPDGAVAAGPAVRPLARLPYTVDAASGELIVDLS